MTNKELESYVRRGWLRVAKHPILPLRIYNYTKKTQYEGYWNTITTKCRGLVLDDENNIIVNCPPKFFNEGEPLAAKISRGIILQKEDGFYISITKSSKYGFIITSRGEFDNKYTRAAMRFITPNIIRHGLLEDISYFCELCQNFPGDESTIVARHKEPRLVCWAIRDQSGVEYDPVKLSPFPIVRRLTAKEMNRYLKEKVEGVVIFSPKTGERLKIKTKYWLEQHKIISNFSKKYIWEILKSGRLVSEVIETDELLPQAMKWAGEIKQNYNRLWTMIQDVYSETESLSDKELGLLPEHQSFKKYLFLIRRDKDQEALNLLWQEVKPHDTIES